MRTMFDCKISALFSGTGSASCQLYTATFSELKAIELVKNRFPINLTISSAKEIFDIVDVDYFIALPSGQSFGSTHFPLSNINIVPVSPLHRYLYISRVHACNLSPSFWMCSLVTLFGCY